MKEAQDANISSCDKLYKEGRATLAELVSKVGSCVLSETREVGQEIRDLVKIISDLQKNLPEQVQNFTQCFKNPASCLSQVRVYIQSI